MSEKKIIGTTNSGVPIYNYENAPQNMPIKKSSDIEKVIEHVEKYLGPISYVSVFKTLLKSIQKPLKLN